MSTELIRSISIDHGEVRVSCASSNVTPITFETLVDETSTRILKQQGLAKALSHYGACVWEGTYRIQGKTGICNSLKAANSFLQAEPHMRGFLDAETAGRFIGGYAAAAKEKKPWDTERELQKLRAMRYRMEDVMDIGSRNPAAFEHAAVEIQRNRDYALEFTKAYGDDLGFRIPQYFLSDREVVEMALRKNGFLYGELEGTALAEDREIILLSYQENLRDEDGRIRRFHAHLPNILPESCQEDPELMAELIRICPSLHAQRLPSLLKDYTTACLLAQYNRWFRSYLDRVPPIFLEQKAFQLALERGDRMREGKEEPQPAAEKMRSFKVTICCSCWYKAELEVPADYTREEALEYARDQLPDIPLGELEYIPNSDELDEENCDFVGE